MCLARRRKLRTARLPLRKQALRLFTATCVTRKPARHQRRVDLYREVTERIRESDTDVVINLTAGMGGDLVFGTPRIRCR